MHDAVIMYPSLVSVLCLPLSSLHPPDFYEIFLFPVCVLFMTVSLLMQEVAAQNIIALRSLCLFISE